MGDEAAHRVATPNKASPKRTPKAKRKLLAHADTGGLYFEAAVLDAEADPLAEFRRASAAAAAAASKDSPCAKATGSTSSERSTLESEQQPGLVDRKAMFTSIFQAMDTNFSGVVQFSEVTRMVAIAHRSGSTGSVSKLLASPRTPRSTRAALPSARVRPSNAVALSLPDAFSLEVRELSLCLRP